MRPPRYSITIPCSRAPISSVISHTSSRRKTPFRMPSSIKPAAIFAVGDAPARKSSGNTRAPGRRVRNMSSNSRGFSSAKSSQTSSNAVSRGSVSRPPAASNRSRISTKPASAIAFSNPSRFGKCRYTAIAVIPTPAATRRIETASAPSRSRSWVAASRIRSAVSVPGLVCTVMYTLYTRFHPGYPQLFPEFVELLDS